MRIEIIEHCFGPDVRIDGESLSTYRGYDNTCTPEEEERISSLKDQMLQELSAIKGKIDMREWREIANIITNVRGSKFELDEENSSSDSCDQCGNWNSTETYNKIKEDE
jgi:hypothetical protein